MGGIKSFISPPKPKPIVMPAPVPITPKQVEAPSATNKAAELAAAEAEERKRLARQKGRSATILTSNNGVSGDDGLSTKKLLGG